MSKKLTPWFSWRVKPERHGVYETVMFVDDDPGEEKLFQGYSRWDGLYWSSAHGSPQSAADSHCGPMSFQNKQWRGLAQEPKA